MSTRKYFETADDWLAFDKAHLWHPYTSMVDPLPCYPVVSAKGVRLKLADGTELIDGMSSWWSAVHGYNHPALNEAITAQLADMSHVMFGGIAHAPAAELGKRLIDISHRDLQHVFFADSGSIAIEVAIKMALQYWQSSGRPEKNTLLTVRGGYHGDPFTCMSVSDPDNSAHYLFPTAIAQHRFVGRPQSRFGETWDEADITEFKTAIETYHKDLAAVIIEPIVQGAGGMRFYHPEYLKAVRALCDELDVLLIFDEIATGFGRTGKLFAAEHANICPDVMSVGKALTGGMMTMAATLATSKVAMGISQGDVPVLMHGPTFMANPLACAVSFASIDLLMATGEGAPYPRGWQTRVSRMTTRLYGLRAVLEHKSVSDVRVLGGIGVVEMKEPVDVAAMQAEFVKRGVWVRPFGKLIYVMPPYIMDDEDLEMLVAAIVETVQTIRP